MGGYRVVELHPSEESLSRWFCLVCQEEVPQRGTMAPTCPIRLAHEASPQHQAASCQKPAVAQQRPQNLLQQRVDARFASSLGVEHRATKRPQQIKGEAPEQNIKVSDDIVGMVRAAADVLEMWLPGAQLHGGVPKQSLVAGQSLFSHGANSGTKGAIYPLTAHYSLVSSLNAGRSITARSCLPCMQEPA